MNKEEIIKNNLRIAKFMGGKYDTELPNLICLDVHGACRYDTLEIYEGSLLKYHSSWDWLMPVVEKIGKMKNFIHPNGMYKYLCSTNISISNNCITIKDEYFADGIYRKDDFDKKIKESYPEFTKKDYVPFIEYYENDIITNIYNACIEFIVWYNKIKK